MVAQAKHYAAAQQVKAIMDDVQPAYLNRTMNRFRQEIVIDDAETLACVVVSVFELSMQHIHGGFYEHSLGEETVGDIMLGLCLACPKFEKDDGNTASFTLVLLDHIQCRVEAIMEDVEDSATGELARQQGIRKLTSLLSMIGHLFVRRMIGARVIKHLVNGLLSIGQGQPEEAIVLAVCRMLNHIGHVLEVVSRGSIKLDRFTNMLNKMKPIYSEHTQMIIAELQNARGEQWSEVHERRVVVCYEVVSRQEALELWSKMHRENRLTFDQMQQSGKEVIEEFACSIRISNMISGQTMALIFSPSEDFAKEENFKQQVAAAISVHEDRVVVFAPDGAPLECAASAPRELLR